MARKRLLDFPTEEVALKVRHLLGCVSEYGKYSPVAASVFLHRARKLLEDDRVRDPARSIASLYKRRLPCKKE